MDKMKYEKKQRRMHTEKMTKNQTLIYYGGRGWLTSPGARLRN
jgi:hypothetical protein